jgi:single-strand DNA-binding protein
MAINVQYSVIGGRLTKKPELKQSGTSFICPFTIAVNLKNGEDQFTEYNECVAFGKTAETIARCFNKGDEIQVVCTKGWRTREWTGKDGSKHYKLEHRVSDFSFVGTKNLPTNQTPAPVAETAAGSNYASESAPKAYIPDAYFPPVGDCKSADEDLPF